MAAEVCFLEFDLRVDDFSSKFIMGEDPKIPFLCFPFKRLDLSPLPKVQNVLRWCHKFSIVNNPLLNSIQLVLCLHRASKVEML